MRERGEQARAWESMSDIPEPGLQHQLRHFQRLPVAQWRPRGLHHQRYATVGTEIRLSDSGKTNLGALVQIQNALTELPAVEVVRVEDPEKPATKILRATLVGWINDQEILLVENDQLVAPNG